jgi:hypothetical protein
MRRARAEAADLGALAWSTTLQPLQKIFDDTLRAHAERQ